MARPITISINMNKVIDRYLYEGKSGKYLNIAVFENKDGPDEYGNDGFVTQDIPRDARDRGEKGPIIGNWKRPGETQRHQRGSSSRGRQPDRDFDRPASKENYDRDYKMDRREPNGRRQSRDYQPPPIDTDADEIPF